MTNLGLSLQNQFASIVLQKAIDTQKPEMASELVDFCLSAYSQKEYRDNPKYLMIVTHTKSTRHLADRAKSLYQQPEYVASVTYRPERPRSVYDWVFTTGRDGLALEREWLVKALCCPTPESRIRSKDRYESWLNERQHLVNDILQFCDIVINEMCFK